MNTLRENAPAEIGGYKVTAVRDYKKDTITDTASQKQLDDAKAQLDAGETELAKQKEALPDTCLLYTS